MSNTGRKKLPTLRESSSTEQVDIFQRDVRKVFRDVNDVLDDLDSRVTTVEGDVQNVTSGNTAVTSVTGVAPIAVTPTVGDVVVSVDLSNVAPASHTHPESDIVNLVTDLTNIQGDITTIQGDITTIETDLAGKIDEVVAGTNLSGGGSSGSVTLNVVDSPNFAGNVTLGDTIADVHTVNGKLTITSAAGNVVFGNTSLEAFRTPVGRSCILGKSVFEYALAGYNTYVRGGAVGSTIYIGDQNSGGGIVIGLAASPTSVLGDLSIDGNVTIGDASGDAHALNGTLNLNATAGANGQVAQIVGGVPQWSDIATNLTSDLAAKRDIADGYVLIGRQIFTSGGTYTPTSGAVAVRVRMTGGGGGGGGIGAVGSGGGGGAGGNSGSYFEKWIDPGASVTGGTVTIGAGGSAGSSGNGGTGGDTSVVVNGTTYTAKGGNGGTGSVTRAGNLMCMPGSANGASSSGDVVFFGPGSPGFAFQAAGSVQWWYGGAGGSNPLGAGGGVQNNSNDGNSGTGYGAGGGGASNGTTTGKVGAAGTAGIVIIEEYA